MPKSFEREEVLVILSVLVKSLESLVDVRETRDLLVAAGTSEYRIEDIINKKQVEEFVKAGFARERFDMIRMIYKDYFNDDEIKAKMQKMCAIEETFVNLVIAHNQNGRPLDNIFNTEIQYKPAEFSQGNVAPKPKGDISDAPKPLEME